MTSCPTPRRRSRRCRRRACVCWRRAREHYKRALAFSSDGPTPKHARLFASLTSQLAAGTLTAGDVAAAERLFRAAAAVYRREKWDDLLGVTLMALKECYRRTDARRAHLETCLELAALGAGNGAVLVSGHGAFDADAAAHAAQAAMREVGGAPDANVVAVGGGDAEGANGVDRAFRCVAGFRAARAVPGEPARFTAAIRWDLPFEVPVASVAVEFSEPAYAWRRAAKDDRAAGEDAARGAEARRLAPRRRGRHAQVGPPRARDGDGGDPRDRDLVPRRARVRRGEGRDARRTGPLERGGRSAAEASFAASSRPNGFPIS